MNFRDFLNMFDMRNMPAAADAPQSKQSVSLGQNTTDWTPQASQTTDHVPTQQQTHALAPLVQAMKQLDPFIYQARNTHFSGTPDFASPEQARGQGKESDSITDLYATFRRSRPELAAMVKPVVAIFKQFHNDFLELCNLLSVPLEWKEGNAYLSSKLDRMSVTKIQSGIQAFSSAMQQVPMDAIMTAQQAWKKMQQSFQNFAASFQSIQQQLMQQIPVVANQEGW